MIPTPLKNHLESVSEQFGGFSAIQRILPNDQIYYLAAFPGPFFVITPWILYGANFEEYGPRLSLAGHVEGETYQVFNREMVHLFDGNSILFGESQREKDLIDRAYHGEYFHILLHTNTGPKLSILWVCKVVADWVKQRILSEMSKVEPVRGSHEVFVNTKGFSEVIVYSLAGARRTALEIKQHVSRISQTVSGGRIIRLTPKANTSYAFESEDGQWLRAVLTGEGESRWQFYGDAHFFEAQNQYQPGRQPLDLGNFMGQSKQAHLFGTLKPFSIVIGNSSATGTLSDAVIGEITSTATAAAETSSTLTIRATLLVMGEINAEHDQTSTTTITGITGTDLVDSFIARLIGLGII